MALRWAFAFMSGLRPWAIAECPSVACSSVRASDRCIRHHTHPPATPSPPSQPGSQPNRQAASHAVAFGARSRRRPAGDPASLTGPSRPRPGESRAGMAGRQSQSISNNNNARPEHTKHLIYTSQSPRTVLVRPGPPALPPPQGPHVQRPAPARRAALRPRRPPAVAAHRPLAACVEIDRSGRLGLPDKIRCPVLSRIDSIRSGLHWTGLDWDDRTGSFLISGTTITLAQPCTTTRASRATACWPACPSTWRSWPSSGAATRWR